MSANYRLRLQYFRQAEAYASTAEALFENEIRDSSFFIEAQIAQECYLCSVLETVAKRPVQDIFGKGRVPHDPGRIIAKIAHFEELAGTHVFQSTADSVQSKTRSVFKRDALALYEAYRACRYPSPSVKRTVGEADAERALAAVRAASAIAERVLTKEMGHPPFPSPAVHIGSRDVRRTDALQKGAQPKESER